jgi:hypothetical protein
MGSERRKMAKRIMTPAGKREKKGRLQVSTEQGMPRQGRIVGYVF